MWLFLSDEEAGVEGGMAMGLASASCGLKNAKNAKNAKSANLWRLAFLALLGRTGDPIVAEAGVVRNRLWQELKPPALRGDAVAKTAKTAKTANPRGVAYLAVLACRDASEFLETLRNLLELVKT